METVTSFRLTTLGHPQRMAIFRLLMRRYPDAVPAGELAEALGIKASTMSAYLSALMRTGLVRQERIATSLRYSADMAVVRQTFDFLLLDCCRGRPDLCASIDPNSRAGAEIRAGGKLNVLFICTGNSARSIFAECILRATAADRFNVYSAGTRPGSQINPFALRILKDKGHDVAGLRSKDISEFSGLGAPHFDFVFTVCNQAANEECPAWEGQPVTGHWGLPDPVKVEGTEAQKALAFQEAYGALRHRIELFTALGAESLNRVALQAGIDDIGRTPVRRLP